MVKVQWQGGMTFESTPESGNRFTMDAYEDVGGQNKGPTPVEALLSSVAACAAMDVISILVKKQQKVTEYWVTVEGERSEPGMYPRPFTDIRIVHHVRGEDLDPAAVARSVQLSDEKYCTVIATLRSAPKVVSTFDLG